MLEFADTPDIRGAAPNTTGTTFLLGRGNEGPRGERIRSSDHTDADLEDAGRVVRDGVGIISTTARMAAPTCTRPVWAARAGFRVDVWQEVGGWITVELQIPGASAELLTAQDAMALADLLRRAAIVPGPG